MRKRRFRDLPEIQAERRGWQSCVSPGPRPFRTGVAKQSAARIGASGSRTHPVGSHKRTVLSWEPEAGCWWETPSPASRQRRDSLLSLEGFGARHPDERTRGRALCLGISLNGGQPSARNSSAVKRPQVNGFEHIGSVLGQTGRFVAADPRRRLAALEAPFDRHAHAYPSRLRPCGTEKTLRVRAGGTVDAQRFSVGADAQLLTLRGWYPAASGSWRRVVLSLSRPLDLGEVVLELRIVSGTTCGVEPGVAGRSFPQRQLHRVEPGWAEPASQGLSNPRDTQARRRQNTSKSANFFGSISRMPASRSSSAAFLPRPLSL